MSITVNISSKDIQNLKANLEVGKKASASENALFNEFSNLLNEISLQLSNNAGASDLKVETAKLKKNAKTENKEPVKEVQKKDAASKKEASVKEAKPLPKREAVNQEVKTKEVENDECPEKEESQEEIVIEEVVSEQVVQEVVVEEDLGLLDSSFVEAKSEVLPEDLEVTEESAAIVNEEANTQLVEEAPVEAPEVKIELKKDDKILTEEDKTDAKIEENVEVKADNISIDEEFIDEEIEAPIEAKTDYKENVVIKEKTTEPLENQVASEVDDDLPRIEKNTVFYDAVQAKLSEKILEDQVVTSEDVKASYLDAAIHVDLFQGANLQGLQSQIETVNTSSLVGEVKVNATTSTSANNNGNSFGFSEKGEGVQGENNGKSVDHTRRSNILRSLGKVEAALKEIARSKDGSTIIMRLDPPELGNLKVSVSIRDGELSARIVADSADVQQVLKEKAGELQQSLKSLGIDVKEVKVSVGSDSNRGFESMMQQQQQGRRQRGMVKEDSQEGVAMANSKPEVTIADHWIA